MENFSHQSGKKIIPLLLLFFSLQANAQTWFEFGLKGGPATTFLMNGNVLDDPQYSHQLMLNHILGLKIGVNFGEQNGVVIDLSTNSIRQKYVNSYEDRDFDTRLFSARNMSIGLLYHRTQNTGYFEIGPHYSSVRSPISSDDGNGEIALNGFVNETYFGGSIGFGGYIIGNEVLTLIMGVRFFMGITGIFPDTFDASPIQYEEPKITRDSSLSLIFELNYSLGYLVRSSCGRRVSYISF